MRVWTCWKLPSRLSARCLTKPEVTYFSATSPLVPPRRSATDGCPSGNGFRVTVPVQSNSWHYIVVGYAGSGPAPATKLTVALS